MSTPTNKKNGCLWIFIFGLITLFGWIFISTTTGLNSYVAVGLSMLVAAFLTSKWVGKPTIKGLIVNGVIILVVVLGLRFVSLFLLNTITPLSEENNFKKEEGVALSTLVEDLDTVSVYSSHRIWKDNYGNNYSGDLMVRENDFHRLKSNLSKWSSRAKGGDFWGNLYDYLERTDTPSLDLVMNTFEEIHQKKKLNQMEFAEMVVSCIQDIPYSFIFQEECLSADSYEPTIRTILKDCPDCCMGNVPFGIQNPVSFLQNLKGDCDTRTVIIYSILKHFNYDVAILNSTFYRHSILGINLPATGVHKKHYGKKYVVWETTAKYYPAGSLPSNFNDITHWNIVLTSK